MWCGPAQKHQQGPITCSKWSNNSVSSTKYILIILRYASFGIRGKLRNKVISFCYFRFFSVPFFQCLRSSSCSSCLRHLSKKKEREIEITWNLRDHLIFAAETQLLVNHKQTTSESFETSYSVYWGWDRIICQMWSYSHIVCLMF